MLHSEIHYLFEESKRLVVADTADGMSGLEKIVKRNLGLNIVPVNIMREPVGRHKRYVKNTSG